MSDIKVAINGILGKMGQSVLNATLNADGITPISGCDSEKFIKSDHINTSSGKVNLYSDLALALDNVDVIVDFTNADVAREVISLAPSKKVHCVIGSTGLSESDFSNAKKESEKHGTSIIIAPNFALGAVLMTHLIKESAKFFDYADLTEVHHEAKIDSPSGTAISMAKAAHEGKNGNFKAPKSEKELIDGARGADYNGVVIHSGRMPGRVAHHEMVFGALGQTLTIRHDSINRESFMPGVVMSIRASMNQEGLTVGLDKIMGLE